MEYWPKLTVISMLLGIGLLKVMHFNDVHLLYKFYSFTDIYVYTGIWMEYYGML